MNRRHFLAAAAVAAAGPARAAAKPRRILLRSSWQTVNIGDIAHTPGMLALLEKAHPDAEVTLWPNPLTPEVEKLLTGRFPKLRLAASKADQEAALAACDFFLHGSGPGLVGHREAALAQKAGKPYGFAGVTLSDDEIKSQRALLAGAKFVFTRDTDSLKAITAAKIDGPKLAFGPDATFALDLRDEAAADKLLKEHQLEPGKFLVAVPRLRYTPYWEVHPERVKPNPERSAVNELHAGPDHAKARDAIVAWVRETKARVLLAPEMTYAVPRLRPFLYDPLPANVKPHVAVMARYWHTAEAASVYRRAAVVVSLEMHSPIIAVANGVPAIHVRQPTDTRKGQMWRDVGLAKWLFEIDATTGAELAARVVEVARDGAAARATAEKARATAHEAMTAMVARLS